MAVSRNERTYPLALKADPLNVGIVAAYDWAAEDGSTTASNGKDHSGNARHWTPPAPDALIVQTVGGKGRDTSQAKTVAGKGYEAAGAVTVGLAVGTGDFSVSKRFRIPTHVPDSVNTRELWRLADSGGAKLLINLLESNTVGGYRAVIVFGTNILVWNSPGNPTLAPGSICDIHVTRVAGTAKCFVNGVLISSATGNTVDWLATTGASKTINGNYGTGETMVDAVYLDDVYWNRGLTDEEVAAHSVNPYSYYENQAAANGITISAPTEGATAGTSITVSGTYSGADTPSAIEASFNGGAWATIVETPSGGSYSGTLTEQAVGTGALSVRWVNKPEVTASIASITVAVAGIALTAPSAQQSVQAYRMFQRNAQNQATVRISCTYTGTPTAIEYRWNGGPWVVLDAAPTAGAVDKEVTLQGPGQGDIEVRFANATGVTDSLAQVGVGDVFVVAGQSNHVGMSAIFVPPVAPADQPSWQSIVCSKDGVWRPHLETNASPFDSRANALYAVQDNGAAPFGSYFGALATKIMASGVPVAFVPCALGSSSLEQWVVNEGTTWLFGAALARAALVGDYKALLWWQGEAEAGGTASKAELVTAYNLRVDGWFSRTSKKWFVWAINSTSTGANFQNTHDALIEVGQTNPNVAGYADLNGSFSSSIHYGTAGEINEIASRTYAALNTAYEYEEAQQDTTAPSLTGEIAISAVTTAGGTLSWSAATGDVAGYEYSTDGGTSYISVGMAQSVVITGLQAATGYPVRARAFDAAGNRSAPPLAATLTTATPESGPMTLTPAPSRTVTIKPETNTPFSAGSFWNLQDPKKPKGSIDPDAVLDIPFDFTPWLTDASDTIAGVAFLMTGGLVDRGSQIQTGSKAVAVVIEGGGTAGAATLTCRITTASAPARIIDRTVYLTIEEQ